MPFVGPTAGGSWLGTVVPNCKVSEQLAITEAFTALLNIGINRCVNLGGLDELVNCLHTKTIASVDIDCCGSGCWTFFPGTQIPQSCNGPIFANAPLSGNSINLCGPALPPNPQAVLDATLFHELIHSCGGLEIDAWALENHCYVNRGTINPPPIVKQDFLTETTDIGGGLRAGRFLLVERATGRVFVKRQTTGAWLSTPTLTSGAELSVNAASYQF